MHTNSSIIIIIYFILLSDKVSINRKDVTDFDG